jgi:hypothetical protein
MIVLEFNHYYKIKMENIPYLALDIIFKNITFEDVMNMLQIPTLRDMVIDYYSYLCNRKDLKKRAILECLENNLLLDHIDFFHERGYQEIQDLPIYEELINEFYFDLNKRSHFVNHKMKLQIQNYWKLQVDPHQIFWTLKYPFDKFMDILNQTTKEYDHKISLIEQRNREEFFQIFFHGKDGYVHVMDFWNYINLYFSNYTKQFIQNVNFRLNKIKTIFE